MKKKLLIAAGLIVVAAGIISTQLRPDDTLPSAEIPTKKLPSPNGYDFYVRAGKSLTTAPKDLDAILDSQNLPEADWKTAYPIAKKEAWLAQNAGALKTMRQGFHYSAQVPPKYSGDGFANTHFAKFRSLARALVVESRVRSERGNWGAAAQSATDILKLSHGIARGGVQIDALSAGAIESLGWGELARIRPHLNSDEATVTAKAMENLFKKREKHVEILQNEKYTGQALLLEAMKQPNWQNIAIEESSLGANLLQRWQMRTTSRKAVFQNYSSYMDALISNAKKPYNKQIQAPPAPQDFYNRTLGQAFNAAYMVSSRQETRNTLAFVAMALHAYKLYHNRYPENLSDLTPRYLQEIPADPFGGGKPLRYRHSGDKYLLYSVGPDGKDDGGADLIIDKEKLQKSKDLSELIQAKGDMAIGSHWKNQRW